MKELLQQVLDTPGCERLRDFASVGPAQRAALELFVDRIRAAEGEPVQWLDVIGAVGRGWRRTGNTRKQMDPDLAFAIADEVKALYTAPPKAAPEATQYIALCDAMGYNERKDSLTSPEEHAQSLVAEIKRLSDAHRDELLAEIKRLKEQAALRESWVPYLSDRADGVKGHYAIARWNPRGYREVWNLRTHEWSSFSDEVLSLEEADSLLRLITIPTRRTSPAPMTEEELHSVLQQVAESLGDVSIVMTHWPQVARAIEARKARP